MTRAICTLYVLAFSFASLAAADTLDARFARANDAFGRGEFAEAVALYEDLEVAGVADADVEHNTALASASLGELGRARLHFERARRLRPRDPEIEAGLSRVLDRLSQRTRGTTGIARDRSVVETYGRQLSENAWARLVAIANLIMFAALAVAVFAKRETLRTASWISAGLAALLTFATGLGWAGRVGSFEQGRAAISLSASPLRVTPSASEAGAATMVEGDLVSEIETFGAFARVRTASGTEGWVEGRHVVAIATE
jgi:hypothetical protein